MKERNDDAKESGTKVVTLRLSATDARRVAFLARVEEISVNEVFKRAFEAYVEVLRQDPEFGARVQAQLAAENEIAAQLS